MDIVENPLTPLLELSLFKTGSKKTSSLYLLSIIIFSDILWFTSRDFRILNPEDIEFSGNQPKNIKSYSQDGCIEDFENNSEFSQKYQVSRFVQNSEGRVGGGEDQGHCIVKFISGFPKLHVWHGTHVCVPPGKTAGTLKGKTADCAENTKFLSPII